MNLEEMIMQSRTSFFHKGLSLNLLRRCWPLWSFWFVLLVFVLPVSGRNLVSGWSGTAEILRDQLQYDMMENCCIVAKLSIFVGILTAMAMFSFLYSARTCGMVNSFPIRRETVFLTAFLTGLLPLLLAEGITAGITMLTLKEWIPAALVGKWLRFAVMGTVAFYGFATFCAMLTGNLFVLPLVYFVLNFTVFVAESAVRGLLQILVYGFEGNGISFMAFSPAVQVLSMDPLRQGTGEDLFLRNQAVVIPNENWLTIYCLMGIVFSVLALLLYRRRRMETVGDTVAIPILKPVFRTCMAFGSALTAGSFITGEFFSRSLTAKERAVPALILLLAGALIGYFAAEMLIQKTMHVFRGKWRSLLVIWAVLAMLFAVCEFDLTGYETRLPDPDEIESASFGGYSLSALKERENIEALYTLHESVIAHKALHENTITGRRFNILYTMKNGREFARTYQISMAEGQKADPASDISRLQELTNRPEAILSRHTKKMELIPANIDRCQVFTQIRSDKRTFENVLDLSPEAAYELYTEAVLPDMKDGTIGCEYFFEETPYQKLSDTTVTIELRNKALTESYGDVRIYQPAPAVEFLSFCVQTDSFRTKEWLRNNAGLEILPMKEAAPKAVG